MLQRTPFELKEIKTLQSLRDSLLPSSIKHRRSLDRPPTQLLSNNSNSGGGGGGGGGGHFKSNLVSSMASINLKSKENAFPFALESEPKELATTNDVLPSSNPLVDDIDPFAGGSEVLLPTISDPIKSSPSVDYLSVSPSFGPCSLSFDNQSFDETTPDEFAPINFLKGITNINYDFTFSDNSAENSISEDVGEIQSRSYADQVNPLKPSDSMSSTFNLDEFDPLRNVESTSQVATTSPSSAAAAAALATASSSSSSSQPKPLNISLTDPKPTTLIESEDSPNQVLLPSPLKPTATDYKGFSNSYSNIPTISCNTGDFSSLNYSDANNQQS